MRAPDANDRRCRSFWRFQVGTSCDGAVTNVPIVRHPSPKVCSELHTIRPLKETAPARGAAPVIRRAVCLGASGPMSNAPPIAPCVQARVDRRHRDCRLPWNRQRWKPAALQPALIRNRWEVVGNGARWMRHRVVSDVLRQHTATPRCPSARAMRVAPLVTCGRSSPVTGRVRPGRRAAAARPQSRNVYWAYLPPRLVTQSVQKRP